MTPAQAVPGGDVASSGAVSYGRRIAQLAAQHPTEPALVFSPTDGADLFVTWQALDFRGNQLARLLAAEGVGPGSMVAVALPNSPDHVATAIGAWRLGACVLPLRHDVPAWERDRLYRVASPDVVVGDWDVPGRKVPTGSLDESRQMPGDEVTDHVADPAMAIASSGSTGLPKIIVSPGPGVFDPEGVTYATSREMGGGRGQTQLIPGPMYHTNGFRITHGALHRDELVVLMERFDAERAVALIERHRVTTTTMVPAMLLRIARLPGVEDRDLSSLQSVLQGGAACPAWLVRWWIDRVGPDRFCMSYGASERVGVTFLRGSEWLEHPGSVGRALNSEVKILNDDGGECPTGEIGHIYLRPSEEQGPSYEYRGAPPAPQTDDGFVTVGDLGWQDADGYLYVADRRVDMIVSGGANVYPSEVEAALLEHPGVRDVAIVGLPDEEWGQRVHAVVEPSDAAGPPGPAELRAHCKHRLAAFKVPKSFEVVDRLPRTEAGKLNRSALAAERSPS